MLNDDRHPPLDARPALLAWSSRYGNLREVTRYDVLAGVKSGPSSVSVDVQDRGDAVLHLGSDTTSQPSLRAH